MTKKDLLSKAYQTELNGMAISVCDVQDFVYSHVCIPKGVNRHPYADVLHEWIEDMTIPMEWFNDTYHEKEYCGFVPQNDNLLRINKEYRIKPSEPVYEWQAYYIDKNTGKLVIVKRDSTDDYFLDWELKENHIRIEETKRIRQ